MVPVDNVPRYALIPRCFSRPVAVLPALSAAPPHRSVIVIDCTVIRPVYNSFTS